MLKERKEMGRKGKRERDKIERGEREGNKISRLQRNPLGLERE
jgi:hypothetical protein